MRYCCELIDACKGGVALTGISEGTLIETEYLLENHPERKLYTFDEFDPLWTQELERYREDPRFASFIGALVINHDSTEIS